MNLTGYLEEDYFEIYKCENIGYFDQALFKILILMIYFVAWVGNMLICYVIACNRHMQTNTNYYLFSLAISDWLLLSTIFCERLYEKLADKSQQDGHWLLLLIRFMYIITSGTSIATAVALTIDRYIAICHPFLARSWFNERRTITIILTLWATVSPYSIGLAICATENVQFCNKVFPLFTLESYGICFFFTPLVCYVVCYVLIGCKIWKSGKLQETVSNRKKTENRQKTNQKSIKMSVAVVMEFFICWGPINLIALFQKYYKPLSYYEGRHVIFTIAYVMFMLSTVINPVIYCMMSNNFRKSFKNILCPSGGLSKDKTIQHKTKGTGELLTV